MQTALTESSKPTPSPSPTGTVEGAVLSAFIAEISPIYSKMAEDEIRTRAKGFLTSHSDAYKRCRNSQESYRQAEELLASLREPLSRALIAESAGAPPSSLTEKLEKFQAGLERVRALVGLTGNVRPPTLASFSQEAGTLSELIRDRRRAASEAVSRLEASFVEATNLYISGSNDKQFLTQAGDQLRNSSSYYPRGKSPEACALEAGLLTLTGASSISRSALSTYVQVGEEVGAKKRGLALPWQRAPQAAPALPVDGYFEQLKNAKAELQATPPSDTQRRLAVAHKLLDLYERSGSAPMAYFATLDCISLGDHSHTTLRKARETATAAGTLDDLFAQLQAIPQTSPSKEVLFYTFLVAKDLKNETVAQPVLEVLRDLWSGSYESNLAGAVDEYGETLKQRSITPDDLTRAERMAIAVWKDARTAKATDMALAALEVAYEIYQKIKSVGGGNNKAARHGEFFLELDAEHARGWGAYLEQELNPSGGTINWSAVEKMLDSRENSRGYLTAGRRAQEVGELDRAEMYFQTARQHESATGRVTATLALAHLLQEQPNRVPEALLLVAKVADLAPHLAPQTTVSIPNELVLPNAREPGNASTGSTFTAPLWNDLIRAQVERALATSGKPFEEALAVECADYNAAKGYLNKGSDLLQQQQETITHLENLQKVLSQLLQKGGILRIKDWDPIASLVAKTRAHGFEDGPPAYASALNMLQTAVDRIDPNRSMLGALAHHDTARQCAEHISRMRSQVTESISQGYPPSSVNAAISNLLDSVKTYQTTVWQVIAPAIVDGENILRRWVDRVETLRPSK